ncbi:hypothetical protein [uncultured Thiodictyon sp.]|nr:hypothetical protein [uncultured Thiodictyon sp.]
MTIDAEKIEFFAFIGLAIWLVFYQFGSSRQPSEKPNEDNQKTSD